MTFFAFFHGGGEEEVNNKILKGFLPSPTRATLKLPFALHKNIYLPCNKIHI